METFKEYPHYDALGLADLLKKKEVTQAEVLAAYQARLERLNPKLNAVIRPTKQYVDGHATRDIPSDGIFAGVPFLLKDLLVHTQGDPYGSGSRILQKVIADQDSELAKRYRATGVVITGKTNTPEFGLASYTEPKATGICNNPWSPDLTAGGSSGGSAAAVAAGIVPMASAGDGGGSIRIPSSFCGIFGLKPSKGRVPFGPKRAPAWHGMVQEHVLTRSVRDSAAMLDAIQGRETGAINYFSEDATQFLGSLDRPKKNLKILVCPTPFFENPTPHPDCLAALDHSCQLLSALGHHLEEWKPTYDTAALARAFLTVVSAEAYADIEWACELAGVKPSSKQVELSSWVLALLGKGFTAADFSTAYRHLEVISLGFHELMSEYDLMITPTMAQPPHRHGYLQPSIAEERLLKCLMLFNSGKLLDKIGVVKSLAEKVYSVMPYTPIFNITGQPAASVPLYWNQNNLPIGVQIMAGHGNEALILNVARQLEEIQPWFDKNPPIF